MSKTEQDLEKSGADDAVDALTTADSAPTAGPNTGEIEALDSALVASIDSYANDADDFDDSDLDGKVASAADFEEAEHALDADAEVAAVEVADAAAVEVADFEVADAEVAEVADVELSDVELTDDAVAADEADEIARLAALVAEEDPHDIDVAADEADEIARLAALVADDDDHDTASAIATATASATDVAEEAEAAVHVEQVDAAELVDDALQAEVEIDDEGVDSLVEDEAASDEVDAVPQRADDAALADSAVTDESAVTDVEPTDQPVDDVAGEQVVNKEADGPTSPASPGIIEELRRANIDGPVVDLAPQDDTTGGTRRRPKKALDYDPAPVPVPLKVPRILGRKPRVRKVTRVVRHVDPWSVFKIALLANFVLYTIVLTAGVLLWNVAYATGTIENVERFFESFGWQSFEFNGGELYNAAWTAGLFIVIGLTGLWVLLATLFNLITDIVGGVRFTVLEEEVVEARTSPMRRFVVRRSEPEIPAVSSDASGQMIREAVIDDSGVIEH